MADDITNLNIIVDYYDENIFSNLELNLTSLSITVCTIK